MNIGRDNMQRKRDEESKEAVKEYYFICLLMSKSTPEIHIGSNNGV
jgi:hypothetical protein